MTSASVSNAVVGRGHRFETVKPLMLFRKIISIWSPPDGLVMDPFAGSGTAGQAVLELNAEAGSTRRWVLIERGRPERGDSYARTLLADRLRRVVTGEWASGERSPLPGGFRLLNCRRRSTLTPCSAWSAMRCSTLSSPRITTRSGVAAPALVSLNDAGYWYLIAKNADNDGFFLIWDGPDKNTDFTEGVYEAS